MYSIELTKLAKKQLRKLPKTVQVRLIAALERCRVRPHHFFERLVGSPHHKYRVGNYRIIAQIQQGNLDILVIELGHRKNIYKK